MYIRMEYWMGGMGGRVGNRVGYKEGGNKHVGSGGSRSTSKAFSCEMPGVFFCLSN